MTRLSNWREESDLFEVVTGKMTDEKALKKVDDKKGIKNKVIINPKLTEAIKNIGGELISIKEQEEEENTAEDQKKKQVEQKQKRAQMIKKQVLMKKLIAVRQGSEDIVAHHEPEGDVIDEAKIDKKLPEYKRATARDKRYGNPHGSHALGGGIRKDRRADHEAKRGVKEGKGYQPEIEHSKMGDAKKKADKKKESKLPPHLQGDAIGKMRKAFASTNEHHQKDKDGNTIPHENLNELNRYGKETGKATGSMNKRPGSPVKKGGSGDKALNVVRGMIRKQQGKPEGQQKKVKGVKSDAGTGKYLDKQKSKKEYAAKAKKAGYKNPQDYANVVARYGSEDNMKKGRGLGT